MKVRHYSKHLPHYLSLVGILIVAAFGFAFFSYDPLFQSGIAVATVVAYVVWGLIHHWLHRDLTLSVVIEYILIAALGLVIFISLLFRA